MPMVNAVIILCTKAVLLRLSWYLTHFSLEKDSLLILSTFWSCAVVMRTKLHKRSFPSTPESVQAVTTGEVV